MESGVYRVRRQLLKCICISFDLEKSLEMKLPGNIQLLLHEKLEKTTLINKTLHFHYLIAKLTMSKEKHITNFSIHNHMNKQLNSLIFFLNCHSYKKK